MHVAAPPHDRRMKFLCPQCKAKYRIADEKLAQRASSRMKCRKCGHVIDIRSALVPESVRPPGAQEPDEGEEDDDDEAPRKNLPRVAPGAGGPPPRRPGGTRPAAPIAKRAAAAPRRGGAAAAAPKTSPSIEEGQPEEDAPTRIHDGGALTAAFSLAVGESPGAAGPQAIQEEWYVGIDGSPLGPLSLAQLREKASSGKATLESLVWRDGFEEWKPIRDFPELVAFLEEAKPSAAIVTQDPHTVPAPAVAAGAARASAVSDPPSDLLEQIGAKSRKPTSHPAAWVAVLVALALGVTIGAVLLSKTEKQEVVKYVEVPASAKAARSCGRSQHGRARRVHRLRRKHEAHDRLGYQGRSGLCCGTVRGQGIERPLWLERPERPGPSDDGARRSERPCTRRPARWHVDSTRRRELQPECAPRVLGSGDFVTLGGRAELGARRSGHHDFSFG